MSETISTTIVPVCMVWSFEKGGYHYVGPFDSVNDANNYGTEHEDDHGLEWHTELVDPAVPLFVLAPDRIDELPSEDPERSFDSDKYLDPFSTTPGAAFHLLMTSAEPLHLVGPFADHQTAWRWGLMNERRDGDPGWQVIWLEDAKAPARLVPPVSD